MKSFFSRFWSDTLFVIRVFRALVCALVIGFFEQAQTALLRAEIARLRERNAELRGELAGYHRLEGEMRVQLTALKKRLGEQDGADWWKS